MNSLQPGFKVWCPTYWGDQTPYRQEKMFRNVRDVIHVQYLVDRLTWSQFWGVLQSCFFYLSGRRRGRFVTSLVICVVDLWKHVRHEILTNSLKLAHQALFCFILQKMHRKGHIRKAFLLLFVRAASCVAFKLFSPFIMHNCAVGMYQ